MDILLTGLAPSEAVLEINRLKKDLDQEKGTSLRICKFARQAGLEIDQLKAELEIDRKNFKVAESEASKIFFLYNDRLRKALEQVSSKLSGIGS